MKSKKTNAKRQVVSHTVQPVVGFPIPTSYEEYLMLTDEQKFRLYEITKKPNPTGHAPARSAAEGR